MSAMYKIIVRLRFVADNNMEYIHESATEYTGSQAECEDKSRILNICEPLRNGEHFVVVNEGHQLRWD